MSTSQEIRSILRDSGVPLTSKQIIEMLPEYCTPQSAYVFLCDAKKRGELETILEDGKAAYRFASNAPTPKAKAASGHDSGGACAPKPRNGKARPEAKTEPAPLITADNVLPPASIALAPRTPPARDVSHLADAVGYAEAALQAYIESVVDKTLYGFLLNARDAARRALEQAHA